MQTNQPDPHESGRKSSHNYIWLGLFIFAAGFLLALKQFGIPLPEWLFSWPMILIGVGLFVGIANGFRDLSWLIVTAIGLFFLGDEISPAIDFSKYTIPLVVMVIGLAILVRSGRRSPSRIRQRRRKRHQKGTRFFEGGPASETTSDEDMINITSIFGHTRRSIYSKDFKGGEIVSIFGGADINLTNADFAGNLEIEIVQVFGGATLIIPPHWAVRSSETVAVFGGIEDKRPPITNAEKVLILRGTIIFGGLEIKSY